MKHFFKKIIILFFLFVHFANAASISPQKIISLAPDVTEMLYTIGANHQIVGVVQGSDYPAAAKNIPVVATYNHLDVEKIVALHPDLIIVWQDTAVLPQLKRLPFPIYVTHPQQLTDIAKTLIALGRLTGHLSAAQKAAQDFLIRYNQLKQANTNQKPLTVFYQVWPHPLITISKKSFVNEVIALCGGKNIFADVKAVSFPVDREAVIAKNPDVIVGDDLSAWQSYSALTAVQQHHLISLHEESLERASPRILIAASLLCHRLAEARHA